MLEISCDECGKKYRVDETRMKSAQAKVKCKACSHIMVVSKSGSDGSQPTSVSADNMKPSVTEPPPSQPRQVPQSVVERPRVQAAEKPTAPEKDAAAFVSSQKIRFGLFGKIIIVMLIVSLLPFAAFWGITLRETSERIRIETENLMAQTALGLAIQIDSWINNNVSILRTAAKLPEIISMNRAEQEPILKAIQKEHPWMYLVFTVGPDGMNVARDDDRPLTDYSDRQYYKDVLAGKKLSWQTLIGRTSKKPALVLAVPIKSGDDLVGVMAAAMTVDDISKNIATWRQGKTGFAFLVDEKGYVVAHPDKQYVVKRKNLNSHPLIASFRKKGWLTTTAKFNTPDGETAFGYVRSNNYGWALVLQQEDKEAFEALNRVQEFALILLGCTVLLVLAISWFSARTIVTPIMSLTDAAERMSLGDLNVKIDIKSKDEIGLLAQAIGRMQTSLRLAMNRLRRKR
ncbi:MAG: zinc-ribbon domain-containing protein [Desulfobacterales bacterium]|nr:MAG: zinc-ribbon domain-containing protein [Desulfobacterales bacterium]